MWLGVGRGSNSMKLKLMLSMRLTSTVQPGRSVDSTVTTLSLTFDGAWDVHKVGEITANLSKLGEGIEPPPKRIGDNAQRSVFMDVYSALARFHMKTFGSTERQFAAVAAKNHHHSTMNPLSQYQNDMSIDEVLSARMISWPLTLPMCAPISDGAAAAILCTEQALERFDRSRAIKVHASILATGVDRGTGEVDRHITHLAARKAYEAAGIGPEDMSVAEVHDASAFAEVVQSENLGFCEFGQGGWLAERGETAIGGRIPINPSGGLESKGHPIGATGLGQIYELAMQLRGEGGARQVDGFARRSRMRAASNLDASAATLRGGWLHTGDLGSMDEEGFLTLKDRSKDLIISGGTNIYPREVEEALLMHPGVLECSVVGRRHSDWGEEVVASLSPDRARTRPKRISTASALRTSRGSNGRGRTFSSKPCRRAPTERFWIYIPS